MPLQDWMKLVSVDDHAIEPGDAYGASYGDTLTWPENLKPATGVGLVHAQLDLDLPRFQKMFVELMTREP